jgi:putative photosynthetic complex assembly protein
MAHVHETIIPKPVIVAAGALLAFTVALTAAGAAGLYKTPKARFAEARASVAAVKSVHLRLEAMDDGTIAVRDPMTQAVLRTIQSNEAGFIHYTLTGMAFSRKNHDLDAVADVRIVRYADGRLMVHEIPTGVLIDVLGYGPTNVQSFAALLDGGAFPQIPGRS